MIVNQTNAGGPDGINRFSSHNVETLPHTQQQAQGCDFLLIFDRFLSVRG